LVWDSGRDGELVLAELCARCAGQADELVAVFGGRGREAMRLTQHVAVSPAERTPVRRVGGVVVRGVVYVLVGVVAFLVITFLTARP
jgi:predicted benzoate:H+ symporter BenE